MKTIITVIGRDEPIELPAEKYEAVKTALLDPNMQYIDVGESVVKKTMVASVDLDTTEGNNVVLGPKQ